MRIKKRETSMHPGDPSRPPALPADQVGVAQRVIAMHREHEKAEQSRRRLTEAGIPAAPTLAAGRYDLLVDAELADRAVRALATGGHAGNQPAGPGREKQPGDMTVA